MSSGPGFVLRCAPPVYFERSLIRWNAYTMIRFFTPMLALLVAGAITGCSFNMDNVLPDRKVAYKRETQARSDLELPPDLSQARFEDKLVVPDGGSLSYSEYQKDKQATHRGGRGKVLPKVAKVHVERDGARRWLVIDEPPDEVWQKVIEFWQENGIPLQEQDPTVGVMRTGWLENRANIRSDFITNTVRKVFDGLYSASTRDQYRVRIEDGEKPGTTDLYLTHFGLEEKFVKGTNGDDEQEVWEPRPSDPDLEAEMLRRLMVYIGASDEQARRMLARGRQRQGPRSQLVRVGDRIALDIDADAGKAWRLVGLGLDRVGFVVEDRDRDAGVYYVRYQDPDEQPRKKGFLDKLKFWRGDDEPKQDQQYLVRLTDAGGKTRVLVQNEQGETLTTPTAARILTLLQEQIR